ARVALALLALAVPSMARAAEPDRGRETFEQICATCHGVDGKGAPGEQNLRVPMPDFTDCAFASREPDADWYAVAHEGGPARGFSPLMPPHGQSLGAETLQLVIAHVRAFCRDARWPAGELNLPRPQLTEKAFPEDEAVVAVAANTERETSAELELIYEKRIGPRAQLELGVPFALEEDASGSQQAGLGDLALALKYALWHSKQRGGIVSVSGEVVLPTGERDRGLGDGTVVLEPALLYGQILPRDFFLHAQLLGEFPTRGGRGDDEVQLRLALGKSFFEDGGFGREWAPMLELQAVRVFARGEPDFEVDLAPQLQVALNRRQHVRLSLGAQLPVNHTRERPVRALLYVLWDWYDGGLAEGW
ncbi:MAG TPA: c-type cytochrome, partial [Myxococcota bacterium]